MSWMKKLFGGQDAQVQEHVQALMRMENDLLKSTVESLNTELEILSNKFAVAAAAQSTLQKHAAALKADHPELWVRYFTKAGRAVRDAEKSMVTPC